MCNMSYVIDMKGLYLGCTEYKQLIEFILWGQVWTRHEEFEILVYTWYKNGISQVYHLPISAKHVSVFRTEPID